MRQEKIVNTILFSIMAGSMALVIGITAVSSVIYGSLRNKNDISFYIFQVSLEMILLALAGIVVCSMNKFLRITLIVIHLYAAIHGIYLIKENIKDNHFSVICWTNSVEDCVWTWPIQMKFHLVYLGALSAISHFPFAVLSMFLSVAVEGLSEEEYNEKIRALIETQLVYEKREKYEKRPRIQQIAYEETPVVNGSLSGYDSAVIPTNKTTYEITKSEEKETKKSPKFNSIIELAAVESPIAYLNRRDRR